MKSPSVRTFVQQQAASESPTVRLTALARISAVTMPTPQPIDDVDIYFETPADDKEHSRFQRAKEQLEIRHRSRMERVRSLGPALKRPFKSVTYLPFANTLTFKRYKTTISFVDLAEVWPDKPARKVI